MRRHEVVPGLWTLALAFALAAAIRGPARASVAGPPAERRLATAADSLDANALALRRATAEQRLGRLDEVVASLEAIDFEHAEAFPEADRAAFLLAQAYLRLGSRERFMTLARTVARWERPTLYTRWIEYERLLAETDAAPAGAADSAGSFAPGPAGTPAAEALEAGILIRDGDPRAALERLRGDGARTPAGLYLRSLANAATGAADDAELEALSTADTVSALGRDLAGAAILKRATRMAALGEDQRPLLATVPAGSRYASRARHMLGRIALENGDTAEGVRVLETLLAEDSLYAGRRDVRMALAGQALDQGRWDAAQDAYQATDRDWAGERDALMGLLAGSDFDVLWSAWRSGGANPEALTLDPLAAREVAERLAEASLDVAARPDLAVPPLDASGARAAFPWFVAPPSPAALAEVAAAERATDEARYALEQTRRAVAREQAALGDRRRYLAFGQGQVRDEARALAARAAMLDSLKATIDSLDARLRALRDRAIRHVAERTAAIRDASDRNALWTRGMRHFHLEGPYRERERRAPEGFAAPDSVVEREAALAAAIRAAAERMAAETPGLIARSYDQAWRPGLIDRIGTQSAEARRSLAWARALDATLDSSIAAAARSPELDRLERRAAALERSADSLDAGARALAARVARGAVERALGSLGAEREAIDYGLAASAYALSVRLGARDSAGAAAAGEGDRARAASGDEALDDPEAARWRDVAIGRMRAFLDRHGRSAARGEIRFRLADLLLVDARQDFREAMARYLEAQSAGRAPGALPLLDYGPALALYRAILAEDRDFEHLDAVLFNAGMILADGGDPEAERFFGDLVARFPESPYGQESYLRLGDMRFAAKDDAGSVPFYEKAAAGSDPSLEAIARYKMGWAHYNQDHFPEAADAFRTVLDLYASARRPAIRADVEAEAEAYLIHSLARAGGARAFADYFDRIGARPYERKLLMALGQHFRRYSLFAEATASDSLALKRYPLEADALISAERLADTYRRWERPSMAREARLDYALRFAPGTEWANAQSSDSVRAAGAEYARSSWKATASEYHREARDGGSLEDWRHALDLYEKVLAHWPDDPEAPAIELRAGEAATQMGEYPAALRHYENAARASSDSVSALAMWQRVAVTDAWYERTRTNGPLRKEPIGSDSLARSVLRTADELVRRYPQHPKAADLIWREANLAFAHGWYERAYDDFGRLATQHPDDSRTPLAAALGADAMFQLGRFEAAGAAYESALQVARRAGVDSLAKRAEKAIPICYYRDAEAAVAADSNAYGKHAVRFEKVATRFPSYELAHVAQYRAGLAYRNAGQPREAVRALQTLIREFPKSEYVQDAHLEIARTWEAAGEKALAAQAFADFAERYPKDASAADAWLKAADLFAAAGLGDRADRLRLAYIQKFPNDVETAMEILEEMARRDLATVGPQHPVSALLPKPAPKKGAPAAPLTSLGEYLKRAQAHPELASHKLLAQVRFLQGEEAFAAYADVRLRLPLDKSLAAKQKLLDGVMAHYRKAVEFGDPEWANASTFRIGQALVAFGQALEASERPADLQGDDLRAYEDVLYDRSAAFYERGENVWTDLLRQKGRGSDEKEAEDKWIAEARTTLWQRLGNRFYYRAEVEFPLVAAKAPEEPEKPKGRSEARASESRGGPKEAHRRAQREGKDR